VDCGENFRENVFLASGGSRRGGRVDDTAAVIVVGMYCGEVAG